MIDPSFQRAQLLFQQQRFDLAADALCQSLAQSPHNPFAHALLGLCLAHQNKFEDATNEAQSAIHLAPDAPFCHYALGLIFQERNRFDEAEASAREAIRLQPDDPDHWSLLAQTLIARQRWQEALDAADHGLTYSAEHNTCVNLRAIALVKLGRAEAAGHTIAGALQRNPHSALSHANQGWTLLQQNNPKQAQEHFREALRLDPNNQWAREGMMEALKARHFAYRIMLRYYLWMSRFSKRGQWGIIIGFWLGIQALRIVKESNPALAPFILPLLIAYGIFVFAGWLASPIFNITLLISPFGRHLLNNTQRIGALIVGFLLLVSFVLIPLGYFGDMDLFIIIGGLALLLTLPTSAAARSITRRQLLVTSLYAAALALLALISLFMLLLNLPNAVNLLLMVVGGCVLSSFIGNLILGMIERK